MKNKKLSAVSVSLMLFWAKQGVGAAAYSIRELRDLETPEESQMRRLRDAEISELRRVLGHRQGPNRKAELYFRLAEIYLETYRSEFLLEGRAHEKRLEKGITDPIIDRTHSKPALISGIHASQEILNFKIPFSKMDQVYYFLGFNYGELDDRKKAAPYYEALVRQFPNSVLSGVASKELGDFYYYNAEYRSAIPHYQRALEKMGSESAPPILHKLAWCHYRTKSYDLSISMMKEVIARAGEIKKYDPLRDDALRDLATLMTESGRVDEAIEYFQKVAGNQNLFPTILEKLGRQYERNVEHEKAIRVYESLLKTHPESDAAVRVSMKLIELDVKAGRYPSALTRLQHLPEKRGTDPETQAAFENLKVLVRKVGTDHHQLYRKKKNLADLKIAESYYTAYVEQFLAQEDPKQELSEIQMYLGEVKQEQGKFKDAAQLYRQVAHSTHSQDSKYLKSAAQLWRASLQELMKKEPHPVSNHSPSSLEKEFIEASDEILKTLPPGEQSREVALRSALVLGGYEETYDQAIDRAQSIIRGAPQTKEALTAAQLWLQMELDRMKQDPASLSPKLQEMVQELRGNAALMAADHSLQQGKLSKALDAQQARVKVGVIRELEKQGDFVAASQEYENVALQIQEQDLAEKAYANALASILKSKSQEGEALTEAMVHLVDVWKKRYPKSTAAVEALKSTATQALIEGKIQTSADLFEKLSSSFMSPESLETAARLRQALGNEAQAQRLWQHFLVAYPNSPRRYSVALLLAQSQEKEGLDGEAARSYRQCSEGGALFQAECLARLGDLYLKNRNADQAKSYFRQAASLESLSSGSRSSKKGKPRAQRNLKRTLSPAPQVLSPFVGYARFKLAELMKQEASFIPLKHPQAQIQKGMAQRIQFFQNLSSSYHSAVEAGGVWSVAALDELASWELRFADEIDAIEPDSSMKPAVAEKFKKNLKTISGPLRDKAKTAWLEAYQKAVDLDLLSPALPQVVDHLADLGVSYPGRAQGARHQPLLAGKWASAEQDQSRESSQASVSERLVKNAKDASAWVDYGNWMMQEQKPLLAQMFYERAVALDPRHPGALNNLGVVQLELQSPEDWIAAGQAVQFFQRALKADDFFIPAKMNLGFLMNYYRLFPQAKTLWEQVQMKRSDGSVLEALAVAYQGVGKTKEAKHFLEKASEKSSTAPGFSSDYLKAVWSYSQGNQDASSCEAILSEWSQKELKGFEKSSVESLRQKCELGKNER